MAGNSVRFTQVTDQEMLCCISQTIKVTLEVWNSLPTFCLEDYSLSVRVDIDAFVFDDAANTCSYCLVWCVNSDSKVIDNLTSNARVHVALSWRRSNVVLKAVATVEELAHISTNVVLQDKTTTRVLVNELFNIEYHLIQNYKLAARTNLCLELAAAHSSFRYDKLNSFAKLELVSDFTIGKPDHE